MIKLKNIVDLSLSRRGVLNRIYFDEKGNKYVGTKEGRIVLYDIAYISKNKLEVLNNTSGVNTGDEVIYQTEVDFGELPLVEKTFTIKNDNVLSTSRIMSEIAYEAPTGKDIDEIEMDSFIIKAGECIKGSFTLYITTTDNSYLSDKFKINYTIV